MDWKKKHSWSQIWELCTAAVFLLFFLIFSVVSLFSPKSDYSEKEKRALQELPSVDGESILDGDFQEDYESYLSDQFMGRAFFVNLKTRLELAFGIKEINGVYIGQDGYLLEQYTEQDFDSEWVTGNIWYLSDFLNIMLQDYGQEHVRCFFVPSKVNVLTEKLPKYAAAYDTSYVAEELREDLTDNLDMDIDLKDVITDLTDILKKHQNEYIYYRTDHHWTTMGAYYAYTAYKKSLGQSVHTLDSYDYQQASDSFYGTTFDKVQVARGADSIFFLQAENNKLRLYFDDGEKSWETDSYYDSGALSTQDQYNYFLGGNTARIKIDTGTENGKVLLLLKDSYSNSFVEYLEQDYETIYMIDLRYVREDIYTIMDDILEEDMITDILVMYNTEKFMDDNNLDWLG